MTTIRKPAFYDRVDLYQRLGLGDRQINELIGSNAPSAKVRKVQRRLAGETTKQSRLTAMTIAELVAHIEPILASRLDPVRRRLDALEASRAEPGAEPPDTNPQENGTMNNDEQTGAVQLSELTETGVREHVRTVYANARRKVEGRKRQGERESLAEEFKRLGGEAKFGMSERRYVEKMRNLTDDADEQPAQHVPAPGESLLREEYRQLGGHDRFKISEDEYVKLTRDVN